MFSTIQRLARLALLKASHQGRQRQAASARPQLEQLEDRTTPSTLPTLDLTTPGAIGSINDAIFRQYSPQPTGTGVIDSFVRIQSIKGAVQQGYNSDYRKVQFDENTSPQFTRSLALADVPVVDIGGIDYREFLLDINQKASQPLLSLDELRIFMGNAPNLTGYNPSTQQLAGLTATYDLGSNWIKLDSRLHQGSGVGDMIADIPTSAFTGGSYVYLYSKFGVNDMPNGGFEEWAAGSAPVTAATGTISGTIVNQATGAGVAGVLVFLDANNNGVPDSNEIFAYTDAMGNYSFTFLATGLGSYSTYQVTVQAPTNYIVPDTSGASPTTFFDISLQTNGQDVGNVNFFLLGGSVGIVAA
jgi:hypothetical protein